MKKNIFIYSLLSLFLFQSCDDYLDIEPKDRVIPTTLEDYRGLMTSAYLSFPDTKSKASVKADEMTINPNDNSAPNYKDVFLWRDNDYSQETTEFDYDLLYRTIFYSNEIIISGGKKLPETKEKKQLIAEAYAMRAYSYFELVNLFSKPYSKENAESRGVPLVLEIDLEKPNKPLSLKEIYNQIEKDIATAEATMQQATATEEYKYRFSKIGLNAFKSRVYLYKGEWQKAVDEADKVLAVNSNLLDLKNNTDGLFPNEVKSPENIMALDYAINNVVNRMAIVTDEVINLYNKTEDLRFALYYTEDNGKYKTNKGNNNKFKCSFRVGEILLLKAEALLKLGKESEAKMVIKQLAEKRYTDKGYTDYVAKLDKLSGTDLWNELMNEREREVAFEGYRWFDLRRNNQKEIKHKYDNTTPEAVLKQNDPRYTIEFPRSAKQENPYLR